MSLSRSEVRRGEQLQNLLHSRVCMHSSVPFAPVCGAGFHAREQLFFALHGAPHTCTSACSVTPGSTRFGMLSRWQVNYVLGDSGRSWLAGFGSDYPTYIWHKLSYNSYIDWPTRGVTVSANPSCNPNPNPTSTLGLTLYITLNPNTNPNFQSICPNSGVDLLGYPAVAETVALSL